MSYYANAISFAAGTIGTLTTNAGSAAVNFTCSGNLVFGDLLVAVVYAEGDITAAQDDSEGWRLIDGGYDSTNNFGIGLFAVVMSRATTSPGGLTLPGSMAWTAQNDYYRPLAGSRWDVAGFRGSGGALLNAASATATSRPPLGSSTLFLQGLNIIACGYNNAGTTTTIGTITGWSERFDTGQTAPPHGVSLSYKNSTTAVDSFSTLSGNLATAKTERAGVRAFFPLIRNIVQPGRTLHRQRTLW